MLCKKGTGKGEHNCFPFFIAPSSEVVSSFLFP